MIRLKRSCLKSSAPPLGEVIRSLLPRPVAFDRERLAAKVGDARERRPAAIIAGRWAAKAEPGSVGNPQIPSAPVPRDRRTEKRSHRRAIEVHRAVQIDLRRYAPIVDSAAVGQYQVDKARSGSAAFEVELVRVAGSAAKRVRIGVHRPIGAGQIYRHRVGKVEVGLVIDEAPGTERHFPVKRALMAVERRALFRDRASHRVRPTDYPVDFYVSW